MIKGERGSGLALWIVYSRRTLGISNKPTKFERQNILSVKKDALKYFKKVLKQSLKAESENYDKLNCINLPKQSK